MSDPKATPIPEGSAEAPMRIGVYVCHCGGNIADVVDVQRVVDEVGKLPNVSVSKNNTFMCSDPGQSLILEDIRKGVVDRVVIAACSPSLHATTFRSLLVRGGLNPFLLEQANIREQCSWAHHNHEAATRKASTLVSMAVAKARHLAPLQPVRVDAHHRALVVGGGVAGLRAARDLAELGIDVVIVEREAQLGGFLRHLDRLYPDEQPTTECLDQLVADVLASPKVHVHTGAELTHIEGYVGNFTATVRLHDKDEPLRVEAGVVIVATGFRLYEPAKREYGYGRLAGVITLADFGKMLSSTPAGSALEVDGRKVRSVGFIHCVGSRQVEGVHKPGAKGKLNTHCSRVCCTATLAAECRLRERFADVEIHDFYQDIRTYGRGHEEYYERASRSEVIFHRYAGNTPPKVTKAPDGDENAILVTVVDGLTWGEEIEVGVDLLVLAVGMMPGESSVVTEGLKLAASADGFLQEVHPKLRPVEMAVNGVLLAGTSQGPKDIGESCASASAAAVKASAILAKSYVELAPYVAHVDLGRCEGTGLCVKECPVDGALRIVGEDGKRHVEVNEAVCTGCGCCVAVCPQQAIDVNGWTLEQYTGMVDAVVQGEKVAT
jgi:heterodisulfide reductase subunit A